jgi:hypothetical protein
MNESNSKSKSPFTIEKQKLILGKMREKLRDDDDDHSGVKPV